MIEYLTSIGFKEYTEDNFESFPCLMSPGCWYYFDRINRRFYRYKSAIYRGSFKRINRSMNFLDISQLICVDKNGNWIILGDDKAMIELGFKEILQDKRDQKIDNILE